MLKSSSKKILVLLGTGPSKTDMESFGKGERPRADYLEIARLLNADVESYNFAKESRSRFFQFFFRRKPVLGSVFSAFLDRNNYDAIYTTGEDIGLPLAMLLRMSRWKGKLFVVAHNSFSSRRKCLFRIAGHKIFHTLICVSEAQRRVLVDKMRIPESKVITIPHPVDEVFFTPLITSTVTNDYVFSCGQENRDYATLAQAAQRLSIPIKVAPSGWSILSETNSEAANRLRNITAGKNLSFDALRETYFHARFIVVPLNDVPYAAGVTSILEAMAMGKPVIVSASQGVTEYLLPDISSLIVPVGDAEALAKAIETLWNDPERCIKMGEYNRQWVKSSFSFHAYCHKVAAKILSA